MYFWHKEFYIIRNLSHPVPFLYLYAYVVFIYLLIKLL